MKSVRLKKALAKGVLKVQNPTSGQVKVFLSKGIGNIFDVDINPGEVVELCPGKCSVSDVENSWNLEKLLKNGHLRIVD